MSETRIDGPAGADWREPASHSDAMVLGFCGYLTASIPELHGVHPQKLADSWERFKTCAHELDGFFASTGEG